MPSVAAETVGYLPVITDPLFRRSLSAAQDDHAFLIPVDPDLAQKLPFSNGVLDPNSFQLGPQNASMEELTQLDMPLLWAIYGVVAHRAETAVRQAEDPAAVMDVLNNPDYAVTLYVPDFLRMLGMRPNAESARVAAVVENIRALENLVGIHTTKIGGRARSNQFAVMQWRGYDKASRCICFDAPYLCHIASTILRRSLKTDGQGNPEMTASGQPQMKASHSYALGSVLASERNKAAVEIVCYVMYLFERAAKRGIPHATARTILNECPVLNYRITRTASTSDQNKKLARAFSGAWKIMQRVKGLEFNSTGSAKYAKKFSNLQVPTAIPKMKTLDSLSYEFLPKKGG